VPALPPAVWVQAVGTGPVAQPGADSARWEMLPYDPSVRGAAALAGI